MYSILASFWLSSYVGKSFSSHFMLQNIDLVFLFIVNQLLTRGGMYIWNTLAVKVSGCESFVAVGVG